MIQITVSVDEKDLKILKILTNRNFFRSRGAIIRFGIKQIISTYSGFIDIKKDLNNMEDDKKK